jgi:hypothetical protein
MGHYIPGMHAEKMLFTQLVVRPAGGDEGLDETFVEAIQAAATTGFEVRIDTDSKGSYLTNRETILSLKGKCYFDPKLNRQDARFVPLVAQLSAVS